jgi:fumarate reductase flavoprotein subunit
MEPKVLSRDCDVVVVGAGLAGWMAAVAAQEQGRQVRVVARATRKPGWGNSMVSGGALHAVLRDPRTDPAELERLMEAETDGVADPAVVAAWAANAARAVAWVEEHGGDLASDPSQSHRAKVFSPVRATEPGMRYKGFGLPNFLSHLRERLLAGGGEVVQPARAFRLERGEGGGWWVDLDTPEGAVRSRSAAVVLADGGFQANRSLVKRYIGTDQVRLRGAGTATGDGLLMGLSVGGQAVNMEGFYGHLLAREALTRDDLWPYPILDLLAAVGIVVNPAGERFVDEAYGGVTTTNALAWSRDPGASWLLCDSDAWADEATIGVTPPNPHLLQHGATVVTAPTVAEVAKEAGIDVPGLERTLDELREGNPAPTRTGTLKMSEPPFYAIPLIAGVTFTFGGLRVDGRAAVLGADGAPIPGLFAAGGTMGGLHGGPRAGYAGGLLEAAVFGLIAGESAGAVGGAGAG